MSTLMDVESDSSPVTIGIGPVAFHHLGVAVSSIEQALPLYTELFGHRVLSGPFEDRIQKVKVCFVGSGHPGEVVVELVEPLGDDSPVKQMLAKNLAAYHVCYEVPDLDAALGAVRARKWVVLGKPVPAVAFEGRRIAWFYTTTKQLVELVER